MVVYTCITNNKDALQLVQRQKDVKYVCFSDKPFKHPVWEYRPAHSYGLNDPRRVARMYKALSHLWFPDEVTIWIDGRVSLTKPVTHFLNNYKGGLCARPHHVRQCIYAEADEVKRINYDDHNLVDRHIGRLRGYPPNNGLHETGMLLRRPLKKIEEFNNLWWAMMSTGSKRDQLSFDYCAWKLGIIVTDVDRADVRVTRHRRPTNATY